MYKSKIHIFKLSILVILISGVLISCSEDDLLPDSDLSIEEKLVGNWAGDVKQNNRGLLALALNFQELALNSKSADWTSTSKDLSNCDDGYFDCDEFSCSGTFIYERNNNMTLIFSVGTVNGPCYDEGTATVRFVDDDTIYYTFTPSSPNQVDKVAGALYRV